MQKRRKKHAIDSDLRFKSHISHEICCKTIVTFSIAVLFLFECEIKSMIHICMILILRVRTQNNLETAEFLFSTQRLVF